MKIDVIAITRQSTETQNNMETIAQLQERLRKYPDVSCRTTESAIEIHPVNANGFPIVLEIQNSEYVVSFGEGWHDQFGSAKDAIECVGFGLSDQCRLKIQLCGNSPFKWTVEHKENEAWMEDSTTGLLLFPFWRKRTIVYLQNTLIRM